MSVTPKQLLQRLEFYEQRVPAWVASAAQIGLTAEQAGELADAVAAARAAYDDAQAKRAAAKSATIVQGAAFESMDVLGAQFIKIIRAFGIATDDPGVFATAQIPEPKEPEPVAPVNPSNLTFALRSDGTLEVRWDGLTLAGTTYLLDRSLWTGTGQPTPFVRVATVSERRYVDPGVPAGTARATYRVSALKNGVQTTGAQGAANFVFVGNGQMQLAEPDEPAQAA